MKFNKKIIIDSLIGLIFGGGIIFIVYSFLNKEILLKFLPTDNLISNMIFFSSIVIAPFLAIAVHELGHLISGLIQGFKTELYVVAFFGIKRIDDKIKVFFNTDLQYFGGVAATSPKTLLSEDELIKKYKLIFISGPISSLVLGLVSLVIVLNFDLVFNPFLGLLGITSLGIFLVTTIPDRTGIFFTDRKRYQRLSDKGETGKTELAFLQIVNQTLLESNCKNIPLVKINILKQDNDKLIQFWGHYFEYQHYKDNGNKTGVEIIKQTLENYKQILPKGIWKSLEID
jgi:hypothetical protein